MATEKKLKKTQEEQNEDFLGPRYIIYILGYVNYIFVCVVELKNFTKTIK